MSLIIDTIDNIPIKLKTIYNKKINYFLGWQNIKYKLKCGVCDKHS